MTSSLTEDAARTICEHMNDDHADAVAAYARTFGKLPETTAARMVAIDSLGMDLEAFAGELVIAARIVFDHTLADATDARETLIAMARTASTP